jgi:hypothetical protein
MQVETIPVGDGLRGRAILPEDQKMAGWQLMDVIHRSTWLRDVLEGEKKIKRLR